MNSARQFVALALGLAGSVWGPAAWAQPGACCLGQADCLELTATDCANAGGNFGGVGSQCPTEFPVTVHLASPPTNLFLRPAVDCANVGTTGPACAGGPLIDAWAAAPLGFGEDSCHQFGGFPESPPIPADFFYPGSEPFFGEVCYLGEPLGETPFGFFGAADTIILRPGGDPFDRCDLPAPAPVQVPIQIVELKLVSVAPITVTGIQGPQQWDVLMDLSTLGPAPGVLMPVKTHCNGGTYDSFLPIQPRFTFIKVGDPGQVRVWDTGLEGIPPTFLDEFGSPWVHELDEGLSSEPDPPPCTEFHPGIEDPDPPPGCPLPAQERTALHLSSPPMEWWLEPALACLDAPTSGLECIAGSPVDAWVTAPPRLDQSTCAFFGIGPEFPEIPGGFFGPGSDPFFGEVCLVGEPLGPTPFGDYEVADTLILRTADPFDRCELPSPTQATVDIQIVELKLESIAPITVQVGTSETLWDVFVDLSSIPAPPGQLNATKEHCNGGTYSSSVFVQPRFTFVNVDNPSDVRVLDTGSNGILPIQLNSTDTPPWVTDVDPLLRPEAPFCTDFHPGLDDPAAPSGCDSNSNGIPDECEHDCNSNGIIDQIEIAAGTAQDTNTNGIPDECDIAECRSNDLNYNHIPDEVDIAGGTATDANTNGIIDEAEQPPDKHSYISMQDGRLRDDKVAMKLKELLVNSNGTANAKDVKLFFQECFGGGLLDDIARELGTSVPWVAGSASRHDELSYGEGDDAAHPDQPEDDWTKKLKDALKSGTVMRALKKAAKEERSSKYNWPGGDSERPQYRLNGDAARAITLADPAASSHHAVLVAGDPDGQRHRNDIKNMCATLKEEWGNLNTNGTSVHVLFGDGTSNPCSGSGVPNGNVQAATTNGFCQVLENLRPMMNENEEFVLYVSDHGTGDVAAVNKSATPGLRGALIEMELEVPFGYVHALKRDPFNELPFLSIIASGTYPPDTVLVKLNGRSVGYLDPAAMNPQGENETILAVPESAVAVGLNALTIDATAVAGPVTVASAVLNLNDINTIPRPGWGDNDGDGDVDLADAAALRDCLNGPGGGLVVPDCANVDIDGDEDVDLDDARLFQQVFTGAL